MYYYRNKLAPCGLYEKGSLKEIFNIERVCKDKDGNVTDKSIVPVEVSDKSAFIKHEGQDGYFVYGADMKDLEENSIMRKIYSCLVEIELNEITDKELGERLVKNSCNYYGIDIEELERVWAEHAAEISAEISAEKVNGSAKTAQTAKTKLAAFGIHGGGTAAELNKQTTETEGLQGL